MHRPARQKNTVPCQVADQKEPGQMTISISVGMYLQKVDEHCGANLNDTVQFLTRRYHFVVCGPNKIGIRNDVSEIRSEHLHVIYDALRWMPDKRITADLNSTVSQTDI